MRILGSWSWIKILPDYVPFNPEATCLNYLMMMMSLSCCLMMNLMMMMNLMSSMNLTSYNRNCNKPLYTQCFIWINNHTLDYYYFILLFTGLLLRFWNTPSSSYLLELELLDDELELLDDELELLLDELEELEELDELDDELQQELDEIKGLHGAPCGLITSFDSGHWS